MSLELIGNQKTDVIGCNYRTLELHSELNSTTDVFLFPWPAGSLQLQIKRLWKQVHPESCSLPGLAYIFIKDTLADFTCTST